MCFPCGKITLDRLTSYLPRAALRFCLESERRCVLRSPNRIFPMPNEAPEKTDSSRNRIYSLDSFATRFIPPAAIALAWWLSGIDLIEPSERGKDWKILGVAVAVFWLAACGSRLVALRPRQATLVTGGSCCGRVLVRGACFHMRLLRGSRFLRCDPCAVHSFSRPAHLYRHDPAREESNSG